MAYTVRQTVSNSTVTVAPLVITMTSTLAGSAIKVIAGSTSSTAGITCTDNIGNSYTAQAVGGATSTYGTLFTCYGATAGVTSITLTYPDLTTHAAMAREYTGLSALDKKTSSTATGTNPTSGSTATTSLASEMVFGALVCNPVFGTAPATVGAGFSNFSSLISSGAAIQIAMEDKAVVSTGTYAATFVNATSESYFAAVLTDTLPATSNQPNYVISY